MNDSTSEPLATVSQQLLRYWIHHPQAQGTVEAIVEWWLLEQQIQAAVARVRSTLAELVSRGWVMEQKQADGRLCYGLNLEKEAEIRAWLELR